MHLTSLMQQEYFVGNNDLGLILWNFENKHDFIIIKNVL